MFRKLLRMLAPIAIFSTAIISPAHAANPFDGVTEFAVTDKDIELVAVTEEELFAATEGDPTREWSNPDSGNSGVTTLTRIFTKFGLDCRELRYDVQAKGRSWIFVIPFCQVDDGSWKIAF